jgi:cytidylate kinase
VLVTLSGLPGSGTTTAARIVAADLGVEWVNGGDVWRAMAAELGMTVAEFSDYAETHPAIDRELDHRLTERAQAGRCVLESRLAGWLVTRAGIPAVRVWVTADEVVRARRVARREAVPVEVALGQNQAREASERLRYRELYDIDMGDLSIYDLVVDSGDMAPQDVAGAIVAAARARFGAAGEPW